MVGMTPLRLILALVAGLSTALVSFAVAYTHGNPRTDVGDPVLAAQLIPLHLTLGLIVGLLVFRAFGRRQAAGPRPDVADRMALRYAHRRRRPFLAEELAQESPLMPEQVPGTLARLSAEGGPLVREGDSYRLR